jgi:hypothetical protein
MTIAAIAAVLVLSSSLTAAQAPAEIPLWPAGAPGSDGNTAKEAVTTSASGERSVSSIHSPSVTPYLAPRDKANGTAILVIPGGNHRMLAITHEGYNGHRPRSDSSVLLSPAATCCWTACRLWPTSRRVFASP